MVSFKEILYEDTQVFQRVLDKFNKAFGINGILYKGKLFVHRGAFKVGNEIIFKDLHPEKGEKIFSVEGYSKNGIKLGKFKIYVANSIMEITNFFEEVKDLRSFIRALKNRLGADITGPLMSSIKSWYLLEQRLNEQKIIKTKDCIIQFTFIDNLRFKITLRNDHYSIDYFFKINPKTHKMEDTKPISMNITTPLFVKKGLKPYLGGILLVCM